MELKNMQLSAKESEALTEPKPGDAPRYPWGLQLTLNTEALEKLGIVGLPDIGAPIVVHARAVVTSTSQREEMDGDKNRTLELQITDLALEAEQAKPGAAEVLYGGGQS